MVQSARSGRSPSELKERSEPIEESRGTGLTPFLENGMERVEQFVLGVEALPFDPFERSRERHRSAGWVVRHVGITERPNGLVGVGGKGEIGTVEAVVECGDPERERVRFLGVVRGAVVRPYPAIPVERRKSWQVTTTIRRPPLARTMTDYTTVSIPKDLADRVEETIEGTSFQSTSDLVRFLLRSIVIQHQKQGELTEAQFDEIAEQLQDLGYLQ